jgi:hypothetical protein
MKTEDDFDRDTEIGFGRYAPYTLAEIGHAHLEYMFWCLTAKQVKDRPNLHAAIEDVVIEQLQERRMFRNLGMVPERKRLVPVVKAPPTTKVIKKGRYPIRVPIGWVPPPPRPQPTPPALAEESLEDFMRRIA